MMFIFVLVFLAVCLIPFAGLLWDEETQTADGDTLTEFPTFYDSGTDEFDITFLKNLGTYFEDHFAYRDDMIDLDAQLKAEPFATSPNDQVIIGYDGWLFYADTMSDYLGQDMLTQREAENIAHNLSLMQDYAHSKGVEFVFTVAPNKNSIYPEYMQHYYVKAENPSMDMLKEELEKRGVNYLDSFTLLRNQDEVMYYKTDTHWTYEAAALAANALLEAVDCEAVEVVEEGIDESFVGDIERMLYPDSATAEGTVVLSAGDWSLIGEGDVNDDDIKTHSSGSGSLLVYHDSFGSKMVPFLAPAFEDAHFIKDIQYSLVDIDEERPDVLMIERVERYIDLLSKNSVYMPAPETNVKETGSILSQSRVVMRADGDFLILEGYVDESVIAEGDEIYLSIESEGKTTTYVPFYLTSDGPSSDEGEIGGSTEEDTGDSFSLSEVATDYGFRVYLLDAEHIKSDSSVKVLVKNAQTGEIREVLTEEFSEF